jgi:hypothetical protein
MIKDQFEQDTNIGDYVIHLMPWAGKELVVSKVIGFRGHTKAVLDLDSFGSLYYTEKFVKVPSGWAKPFHDYPKFTNSYKHLEKTIKRVEE